MDFETYLLEALRIQAETQDLRFGQVLYNYLVKAGKVELAQQINGTELDPYFLDSRVGPFLVFVRDNW